jgi:hypothetical protein
MKAETWIFVACTVFFVLVTPAYALVTGASEHGLDWTGTSALTMATLLTAMVSLYLGRPKEVQRSGEGVPSLSPPGEGEGTRPLPFAAALRWGSRRRFLEGPRGTKRALVFRCRAARLEYF